MNNELESINSEKNDLNDSINNWEYKKLNKVNLQKEINPLFTRYDKSKIEEERENVRKCIYYQRY